MSIENENFEPTFDSAVVDGVIVVTANFVPFFPGANPIYIPRLIRYVRDGEIKAEFDTGPHSVSDDLLAVLEAVISKHAAEIAQPESPDFGDE
jgi:hypothetical protein